ncbi:glycosyltransferase family 4 protein [Sphingobacterium faecium]|uniref:glycosyltransferase family 4 protein n=1 Tax=Sphingobacterium faecium TaxID=34087 RepID=UPI00320AE0FF
MRIIIPIVSFGKGGGNRVLSELSNSWIDAGLEVIFICFGNSDDPYFKTNAKIIWIDYNGNQLDDSAFRIRNKENLVRRVIALTKALNRYTLEGDIVLANEAITAYPVSLMKKKVKKVYYIQADEADYSFFYSSLKSKLMGIISYFTYKLPLIRVVNSPIYFRYNNIRSKFYIPPGIDFDKFFPAPSTKENKPFVIGCIGRFEKFKGTADVLHAFKLLIDSGQSMLLKVAFGDVTSIEPKYLPFIEVVFPENDLQLGDFYRSLDVLISPGLIQNYAHHYPIMEAMACKIPTITTGYLPATMANSWLVGHNSSESIVEAVEFINNKANEMIIHKKVNLAYEEILVYNWPTISTNFLKILKES